MITLRIKNSNGIATVLFTVLINAAVSGKKLIIPVVVIRFFKTVFNDAPECTEAVLPSDFPSYTCVHWKFPNLNLFLDFCTAVTSGSTKTVFFQFYGLNDFALKHFITRFHIRKI
jgi:hypothetical protein